MNLVHTIWRRSLKILALLSLLIVAVYLSRGAVVTFMGQLLVADDRPAKGADAVIILMGDVAERTPHALSLFKEGYAKDVVFAHSQNRPMVDLGFWVNDSIATNSILKSANVAANKIHYIQDGEVTSTIDESRKILSYINGHLRQTGRIILVTSWYHTSRAKWIFSRQNTYGFTIEASPAFSRGITVHNWIYDEESFLAVYQEYLKWLYYFVRY